MIYLLAHMSDSNFIYLKPSYPTDEKYENVHFEEKEYKIPANRPVRIYCDGIFDLFHYGHSRLFSQVKNLFPNVYLIIGVCNDEITIKNKGNVVMNEKERYESVRHSRYVDKVIENSPWQITMDFLKDNEIDYVAHDELPYAFSGGDDVYKPLKDAGLFIPTKRASKISTTGLITRIIKDYEIYVRRQILRGISYKELNISLLKKSQIKLREEFMSDVECMKEEFRNALCYWESFSKRMIQKIKNRIFSNHRLDNENFFSRIFNNNKTIK